MTNARLVRRTVFLTVLVCAVSILAYALFRERVAAPVSPNFIVVVLDDARWDGLDRMPVLQNRIVPESIWFDNAFTPNAVCCPSRASILTGLCSLRHQTLQVSGPLGGAMRFRATGADQETVAVWLHDKGYRTGLFGKYLNDYSQAESLEGPSGRFYVPPGWDRWWALESPEHYGGVLGGSYRVVQQNGTVTAYTDHSSDAQYNTDSSARELREFIAGAAGAGQPFFAYWAPIAPHGETPSIMPAPAQRHHGKFATLPLWRPPSWDEPDLGDKPRWVRAIWARSGTLQGSATPRATDFFRVGQYEALLAVDEQLGQLLDQLVSLGIDRNTFLLLISDNGVGWGEHQMWATKGCPYEECQRVPMLVRYPGHLGSLPRNVAAPVLNFDIAPTLAGMAGVDVPYVPDGKDLGPLLFGEKSVPWRTDYLLEQWRPFRGDRLAFTGQVSDGDRLRLFYGDPRARPRTSVVFEFDAGDGVSPGSVAVRIGSDARRTFAALRDRIVANVPTAKAVLARSTDRLTVQLDSREETDDVYFWEEVDRFDSLHPDYSLPDFFGVRDVAGGFTWVEYETGERELYDLNKDPAQLENKADDPGYQNTRRRLEGRLEALLREIRSRAEGH